MPSMCPLSLSSPFNVDRNWFQIMTFVLSIEKKKGGKAAMKKKMKKQQQKAKNRPVKKAEKEEKKVDIVGQEDALATDNHMDHSA